MAGCAMIGQTMSNVKAGGARTRLSTFAAGALLLTLVVGLGEIVAVIPMAALVAVMIFISVATFGWHSIKPGTLRLLPRGETVVMVATVVSTVATHNLAIGVGVGVLISTHYDRHDIELEITGLNRLSEELHSDLSGQLVAAHQAA